MVGESKLDERVERKEAARPGESSESSPLLPQSSEPLPPKYNEPNLPCCCDDHLWPDDDPRALPGFPDACSPRSMSEGDGRGVVRSPRLPPSMPHSLASFLFRPLASLPASSLPTPLDGEKGWPLPPATFFPLHVQRRRAIEFSVGSGNDSRTKAVVGHGARKLSGREEQHAVRRWERGEE
ncbi:Os01g0727301 [Oryza sativa Japonica Group]|uniref:Os01g0727301 protein n=1 Tax=Oryza sativa subsp. japonica TaxID=39947 RepID=A0A0P0V7N3_ORYSJ|nr:Os01g0727301 [Oryza sativa Japonica Group]